MEKPTAQCNENCIIKDGVCIKEGREKQYRILSPDGFDIEMDRIYKESEIMEAGKRFVERFRQQGYYSTGNREHIELDDLLENCEIIEVE